MTATRTLGAIAGTVVLTATIGVPATATVLASVSRAEINSAPVPGGMCRHSKGHLVNGERDFGVNGGEWIEKVATGRAGGRTVAVVSIGCTAGGVSWPETLVFYRRGSDGRLEIAAKQYLGKFRRAEHASVQSMFISDGKLHIAWNTYQGCCFERRKFTADMRLRGTTVRVTALTKGRMTHPYP